MSSSIHLCVKHRVEREKEKERALAYHILDRRHVLGLPLLRKWRKRANDAGWLAGCRTIGAICRFYLSRHSMKFDINITLPLIFGICELREYFVGARTITRTSHSTAKPPRGMKIDLVCGAFCVISISNRAERAHLSHF